MYPSTFTSASSPFTMEQKQQQQQQQYRCRNSSGSSLRDHQQQVPPTIHFAFVAFRPFIFPLHMPPWLERGMALASRPHACLTTTTTRLYPGLHILPACLHACLPACVRAYMRVCHAECCIYCMLKNECDEPYFHYIDLFIAYYILYTVINNRATVCRSLTWTIYITRGATIATIGGVISKACEGTSLGKFC